jgi:hypothetical protein
LVPRLTKFGSHAFQVIDSSDINHSAWDLLVAYPIGSLTKELTMNCRRCKGLMTLERFSDFFLVFYAWKCINCGAIVDQTITENQKRRSAQPEAQPIIVH